MPKGGGLFYVVFKDKADDYEHKLQVFIGVTIITLVVLIMGISAYLGRYFARPRESIERKVRHTKHQ